MLFAKCDGSVSFTCNNCSIAAKLMHAKTYRSCNCLTERMLRCICVSTSLRAKPQRLIGIAEDPKCHAVVRPYMNSRILRRQLKIYCGLAVLAEVSAPLHLGVGSGKFPLCKQGKPQSFVGKNIVN